MDSSCGRRALLTGGAGFIGGHLLRRLLAGGWRVSVIDNFDPFYSPAQKEANFRAATESVSPDSVELFRADVRDPEALESILRKEPIDVIFHLAALPGVRASVGRPLDYFDVNERGTLQLLDKSREHGIKDFVFVSSSSVYGDSPKLPFSEEDPLGHPLSPYAASKRNAEVYCETYSQLFRFRILVLRCFTVYGPAQRPDLAIHSFTTKILNQTPIPVFGKGGSQRDYTHVSDIVEGMIQGEAWLRSQAYGVCETFNLGNQNPIALHNVISMLEEVIGKKAMIRFESEQPGDVDMTCADIGKSARILGYHPKRILREELRAFLDWYTTKRVV